MHVMVCYDVCMKARTNVSIDKSLLDSARRHGIVLSSLFEDALRRRLSEENEKSWIEENQSEINAYNNHVDEFGVFSESIGLF